jgi:hypothetical protein
LLNCSSTFVRRGAFKFSQLVLSVSGEPGVIEKAVFDFIRAVEMLAMW